MRSTSLLLIPLLLAAPNMGAQTFDQVAPQEVPNQTGEAIPAADAPAPAADDARQLLPSLEGLVFLANPDAVQAEGVSRAGLSLGAVPLLDTPGFRKQIWGYIGKPLTMGDLREISRITIRALRAADRPISDVIIPEQNIQTGTIQLLIVEGRLGEVRTEGGRWFSTNKLAETVRAERGAVISGAQLLDDLVWINQNPFRRVDLVFAPSSEPGETDIVLRSQDRFPVRVYAGYDNSGTPSTDENRWFTGINWGNAFGLEHQLNYQFTTSPDFGRMKAHSGSYVVPLPWRHTFTLMGSYGTSVPEIDIFDLEGETWQISARYQIPLKEHEGLKHSLSIGVDVKRSNNNLAFGGTEVFDQATDIIQAVFAYSAAKSDAYGSTSGELTLVASPGGIGGRNSDTDFQQSRTDADSEYAYVRVSLLRSTGLPSDFRWVARLQAQASTSNLLGSEQLGFGGSGSLRGYDEREVNGDSGAILVNELHTPTISIAEQLGISGVNDRFNLLAFFDAGVAGLHDPLPGEDRVRGLMSAGAGLRYSIAANVIARFDYGWQLRDTDISANGDSSRAHISITVAY